MYALRTWSLRGSGSRRTFEAAEMTLPTSVVSSETTNSFFTLPSFVSQHNRKRARTKEILAIVCVLVLKKKRPKNKLNLKKRVLAQPAFRQL